MVGFQTWTGWWFSWNDIAGIYIFNIYISWHQRSMIYLNFGVRFKSGTFFKFIAPLHHNPSPTHCPPHYPPTSLPHWKPSYHFILYQDKFFFVIVFIIFLQYKMIFSIDPHYTLNLFNYFSLWLIWQGGVQVNGGNTTTTLVCV